MNRILVCAKPKGLIFDANTITMASPSLSGILDKFQKEMDDVKCQQAAMQQGQDSLQKKHDNMQATHDNLYAETRPTVKASLRVREDVLVDTNARL